MNKMNPSLYLQGTASAHRNILQNAEEKLIVVFFWGANSLIVEFEMVLCVA